MQLFAGEAFDEETRVGLRKGFREDEKQGRGERGKGVEDNSGRNKTALVEFSGGRFMIVPIERNS